MQTKAALFRFVHFSVRVAYRHVPLEYSYIIEFTLMDVEARDRGVGVGVCWKSRCRVEGYGEVLPGIL